MSDAELKIVLFLEKTLIKECGRETVYGLVSGDQRAIQLGGYRTGGRDWPPGPRCEVKLNPVAEAQEH